VPTGSSTPKLVTLDSVVIATAGHFVTGLPCPPLGDEVVAEASCDAVRPAGRGSAVLKVVGARRA